MDDQLQLKFISYKKDAYIIVEGKQNADQFFIVQQGKIGISKEVEVAEEEDKVLNPGGFFGVISSMSGHSHIETAQALTDVVLIAVHRDQFGALIQKKSQVAMKIIMQFSKRLRHLNETLAGISMKKTAETSADHLSEVGEYYFRQKQYSKALYIFNRYLKHCPTGASVALAKDRITKARPFITGQITEVDAKPTDLKRTYPKDTMLFVEGEPGHELFIIQRGRLKSPKLPATMKCFWRYSKWATYSGRWRCWKASPAPQPQWLTMIAT